MQLRNHLKSNIGIYNIIYTGVSTITLSSLVIVFNGVLPTVILIAGGVCLHNVINKVKDKICEIDPSSQLGKYKLENTNLKDQISNKEAMLVALRAELINYSTKPVKRTKKEAENFINGILSWCGETAEMNTMSNLTQEHTTKQRDSMKKFLESNIDQETDKGS